jgi:histidinol-phosphatase (PHP family)
VLDLHVHVWPHQPGTATPTLEWLERCCVQAAAKGIDQIAITEHSHRFTRVIESVLPHWERPRHGPVADATMHVLDVEGGADLDAYVEAVLHAQDQGLPVLVGLEVDHLPGATSVMASVLADYPFDVLLGSVHWLDEWLFDAYGTPAFAAVWDERDTDSVFAQYVDAVLELVQSGTVDVLAHLDVIKVAGHRAPRLDEHEDRLIEGISPGDIVIELSSAGLRKPVGATYPSSLLLDRVLEAGFELTTASDAHSIDQIGWGFEGLVADLDARAVRTLTSFRRRQRQLYTR